MKNKNYVIFAVLVVVSLVLFVSGAWFLIGRDSDDGVESEDTTSETDEADVSGDNDSDNEESDNIDKRDMVDIKSQDDIPKAEKDYRVTLNTEEGDIVLELTKDTPVTTGNFATLAEMGFYDGVIFHRVIDGFMIQGGDPDGTGTGGPGYKFDDEPFEGEYTRGTVAMANSGPNTNGSQFFIMHDDYPLQPNYTIFGKVVEGMEVVDKIATAQVETSASGEQSKPKNPVKIISTKVEEM